MTFLDATLRINAQDTNTNQVLGGIAEKYRQTTAAIGQAVSGGITRPTSEASRSVENLGRMSEQHIGRGMTNNFKEVAAAVTEAAAKLGAGIGLEEFARRAYVNFADVQRGLERIQFATGANEEQIKQLNETIDTASRLTGRSFLETQQAFGAFMASTNLTIDEAKRAFASVAEGAAGSGVQVEQMSRAVAAAINNLNITSQKDIKQLVGSWQQIVPSALMGEFANVVPRLTETMHSLGFTGAQAGRDVGAMFVQMERSLGNPRLAASALNDVFAKMRDMSSPLGAQMLPVLANIQKAGGTSVDALTAMIAILERSGVFSGDIQKRTVMQQAFGLNDADLRALDILRHHLSEIARDSHIIADPHIFHDAKQGLDDFLSSLEGVSLKFGELIAEMGASDLLNVATEHFNRVASLFHLLKNVIEQTKNMLSGKIVDWDKVFDTDGLKDTRRMWELEAERMKIFWDQMKKRNFFTSEPSARRRVQEIEREEADINKRHGGPSLLTPFAPGGVLSPRPPDTLDQRFGTWQTNPQGQTSPVTPQGGGEGGAAPSGGGTGVPAGDEHSFNQIFKGSPLEGKWSAVKAAADREGVPPSVMAAVMAHETGKGRVTTGNNVAGLMDPKTNSMTKQQFGSIDQGIDAAAKVIGRHYKEKGGNLEAMGKDYAPPGAANDPHGQNSGWAAGVRHYLGQMGSVGDVGGMAPLPSGHSDTYNSAPAGGLATVRAPDGRTFHVAADVAENFQGFINDYYAAGGRFGKDTGTVGERPNASAHPGGYAMDVNQAARDVRRGGTSLDPNLEDQIAAKWGLVSGHTWRNRDTGHFEVRQRAQARAALQHMHQQAGSGGQAQPTSYQDDLRQLHDIRSQLERPIKMRFDTSGASSLMATRQRTGRRQVRQAQEDALAMARYSANSDIGFA